MKKKFLAVAIMFFSITFLVACGGNKFKVTFDAKGGTPVPAVQEIGKNQSAVKPANPKKDGFEFDEWQLNGVKYTFTEKVTGDITLVAKWREVVKHLVKFDYGDGQIEEVNVQNGQRVAEPNEPTKDGFLFLEWQLDGETFDFSTTITKPINLIASWKKIDDGTVTYVVTFDSNGGSAVPNRTVIKDNKVAKPANPTKDGFTFVEWQLDGVAYNFDNPVTKAITLKAFWKENTGGGRPTEIVIMHGAVHEVDPRHKNFTGTEKGARTLLHEEIEAELNVKIVYKEYPASAPWGPGRQEKIIEWHLAGNAQADIYWITTIWLTEIVKSNAITPINKWLNKHGSKLNNDVLDMTTFAGNVYGFAPEPFTGEKGLFYNVEMLENLGLEDPVDLWNKGEWTWDSFEAYANNAKSKLTNTTEQAILGGAAALWAVSFVPLNGGHIVDPSRGVVGFGQEKAEEVYTYLGKLNSASLFESNGGYDAGSDAWAAGNVLFHPGALWFVRASNRFGDYEFVKNKKIGVVPYPLPPGVTKDKYKQPIGGEAIYTIASNSKDKAKEELAFEVWNRIQTWDELQSYRENFEDSLIKTFDNQKYIDVYMEIFDKIYYDAYEDLGISQYGPNSWYSRVNSGIKDGSSRAKMAEILDIYQEALDAYLGKK